MWWDYAHFMFVFAWILMFCFNCGSSKSSIGNGDSMIKCIAEEREALLHFKQGIQFDRCGWLNTSWVGQECCKWYGVRCNNYSGHVIGLYLPGNMLSDHRCYLAGSVSPLLAELRYLEYLDLSYNFIGQTFPSFLDSFHRLRYLNLSNTNFEGEIRHQLANLTSLTSLDLSGSYSLYAKSLGWLSSLTLLRDIDLSQVNLTQATDWVQSVSNLPALRKLQMNYCHLPSSFPSSLVYTNSSTSLSTLVLSRNHFVDPSIIYWLFNFTALNPNLVHLDISGNSIPGHILSALGSLHSLSYLDLSGNYFLGQGWNPESLKYLCSLRTLIVLENNLTIELSSIIEALSQCAYKSLESLDISYNSLWGSIPEKIGTFSSLRELDLIENKLNGTINPNLGQLSFLETLDLSYNSLQGTFSDYHLSNLSRLRNLELGNNSQLLVNISDDWVPPFQLDVIMLGSCKIGPHFPKWLLAHMNFSALDISNAGIFDTVPLSFWKSLPANMCYLNMANNHLHGTIPDVLVSFDGDSCFDLHSPSPFEPSTIDLSSNSFTGAIPSFLANVFSLMLNDNMFTNMASFFCPENDVVLAYLDLSNNSLSGKLPNCWGHFAYLNYLQLDDNNLSGNLPRSICVPPRLEAIHLRNNNISGELSMSSFENCTSLVVLDLSNNNLTGQLPYWLGNTFKRNLVILNLRSNSFSGSLPSSLCMLSKLIFLDLSSNHFFGRIPNCISNLTAMVHSPNDPQNSVVTIPISGVTWSSTGSSDFAWIMWKRKEWSFKNSLGLVKAIDVSNNELEGPIPDGISSLTGLVFLNFSRNRLNGSITPSIGQLTYLEFLDLSSNKLCGQIPTSLSSVSYLEMLDLSNNNLSGRIPTGTQLQSFDPSSYMGNPGLCGDPLPKCPGDQPPTNIPNEDNTTHEDHESGNDDFFLGLIICVILGFIIGFWGVCGTLVIKRSWRIAYFRFFEDIKDRIHVMVVVNIARAWRKN